MDSVASLLDAGHQPGLVALLAPAHLAQEVEVLRVQEVSPGHGTWTLWSMVTIWSHYGQTMVTCRPCWCPHCPRPPCPPSPRPRPPRPTRCCQGAAPPAGTEPRLLPPTCVTWTILGGCGNIAIRFVLPTQQQELNSLNKRIAESRSHLINLC